jgi:hypothetical protein
MKNVTKSIVTSIGARKGELPVLFLALLAMAPCAMAQSAMAQPDACTASSVKGTYGLIASGTWLGIGPVTANGVITINGNGGFTYSFVENVNGSVTSGTIPGTYSLYSNCLGTVSFPNGQTFSAVVVLGGQEIDLQSTSSTIVQTIVAKKTS